MTIETDVKKVPAASISLEEMATLRAKGLTLEQIGKMAGISKQVRLARSGKASPYSLPGEGPGRPGDGVKLSQAHEAKSDGWIVDL